MSANVLILGAEGIAGSVLMRAIPSALGTTRRDFPRDARIFAGVDITERGDVEAVLARVDPDVIVNCTGIVKSECESQGAKQVYAVNAEAPHMLADLTARTGCRVVHLSTDCVFDGGRGLRTETDTPDAEDLYGKSKAAGELVHYDHCLTLRTSFIGWDQARGRGLLEWLRTEGFNGGFASRSSSVEPGIGLKSAEPGIGLGSAVVGYARALWSGLSAPELARVIVEYAITERELGSGHSKEWQPRPLSGLYHVAGPIISKAELLETLIRALDLPCRMRCVNDPRIDRTLDDTRFRLTTGYAPPTWERMAKELGAQKAGGLASNSDCSAGLRGH